MADVTPTGPIQKPNAYPLQETFSNGAPFAGNTITNPPPNSSGGGGGGGGGNPRQFEYTFLGNEGPYFVINMPVARANTNYGVQATFENTGGNDYPQPGIDTKTVNSFKAQFAGQVAANVKIVFLVSDLQ